jgi:hypothetical protein
VLFGAGRLLTALLGIPWVVTSFVFSFLPSSSVDSAHVMPLFDVRVEQPGDSFKNDTSISENRAFAVSKIKADLLINLRTTDAVLSKAIRYTVLPGYVTILVLSWIMLGQLRDLCARAEKGEIFTERNLNSIRNLGAVLIAGVIVECGFSLCAKLYLSQHLPALSMAGSNLQLRLDWSLSSYVFDLIPGLLVLLVAEAFRQGLALKKENDLTV